MATIVDEFNDKVQQSRSWAVASVILADASHATLKGVADLNYLDTTGSRLDLIHRICDDIHGTGE